MPFKLKSLLSKDQNDAINFLYENDSSFLIADMGAGKTVCALTALSELLMDGVLKRIIIFATLKIANNVWQNEASEWEHLHNAVTVGIATGDPKQRKRVIASGANVVVMTFNNIPWFLKEYGIFNNRGKTCIGIEGFDGMLIDEISKLRNSSGAQWKAAKKFVKFFKWRCGMTGTPVAEDWAGLFGQVYMVDAGVAFGHNKEKWLKKYFMPLDYQQRRWGLRSNECETALTVKIAHLIFIMPDYRHELPELNIEDWVIPMDTHTRILYKGMIKDLVIELKGKVITSKNAGVLSGKLHQMVQGFLYLREGDDVSPSRINRLKIDALDGLIEEYQMGSKIIVYWFKEDLDVLKAKYPGARELNGNNSKKYTARTIKMWNEGLVDTVLMQPSSAGHGLNLAKGGFDMIFYTNVWSNDLTLQTIARIWRRGQRHNVNIVHMVIADSLDDIILMRVNEKSGHHNALLSHFKNVITY